MRKLAAFRKSKKIEPVKRGLVEWFDFMDGKGTETTLKSRVSDNVLTLNNFNFDQNSGWTGKGLKFDGVDDYASNPKEQVIEKYSIEFCMVVAKNTLNQIIRSGTSTTETLEWDNSFSIYSGSNVNLRAEQGVPGAKVISRFAPIVGEKLHFVFTSDLKFYINGMLVENQQTPVFVKALNTRIEICGSGDFGKNTMYSIKLYSRILTDTEIQQNYEYEQSIDRSIAVAYPLLKEEKSYGVGLANQLTEEQLKTFRLSNDKTKFVAGLRYCEGLQVEEYTYTEILKIMETEEWESAEVII